MSTVTLVLTPKSSVSPINLLFLPFCVIFRKTFFIIITTNLKNYHNHNISDDNDSIDINSIRKEIFSKIQRMEK